MITESFSPHQSMLIFAVNSARRLNKHRRKGAVEAAGLVTVAHRFYQVFAGFIKFATDPG